MIRCMCPICSILIFDNQLNKKKWSFTGLSRYIGILSNDVLNTSFVARNIYLVYSQAHPYYRDSLGYHRIVYPMECSHQTHTDIGFACRKCLQVSKEWTMRYSLNNMKRSFVCHKNASKTRNVLSLTIKQFIDKNIGYIAAGFLLYISYFTWLNCVMESKIAMLKTASKHI